MQYFRIDWKHYCYNCLGTRPITGMLLLFYAISLAETLDLADQIHRVDSLSDTVVNISGHTDLHLTGTKPLSGYTIHLNSIDSWLFLDRIKPSVAALDYLNQVKVNGASTVLNSNVRVVEYTNGSVIIPHAPSFQPLEVFTGENFMGTSAKLSQYTAYNANTLGPMASSISSFILKRGYTATFAENADGTGYSKNYIAQDCDLEIGVLPVKLNNRIHFVRVFPWRWVSKKGCCDIDPVALNAAWHYNWNISKDSALDWEYVAIRQQPHWPGLNQDWKARGVSHLLGFNEPDNPVEDAYKHLDSGSRDTAIAYWPPLLETGLRLGAPAVTDGGKWWITEFMSKAEAADLRVDYVPVHYYRGYSDPTDANGAALQMYYYLKGIYDIVKRPLWVTEFNNGANWTSTPEPTLEQNRNAIEAMIKMMDEVPWIERYSIYSDVKPVRRTHFSDGRLTPMGTMYRDHLSPIGYRQEAYGPGKSANAFYPFEKNFRDDSGNGNYPLVYGRPSFKAGRKGNALSLNGSTDYLVLPPLPREKADFTFAAWVYWNGGTPWQRIFDFGESTSRCMFLTPIADNRHLRFAICAVDSDNMQQLESDALPVGNWTHITVTINGNTGRLYINGDMVDSGTILFNPSTLRAVNNLIGKSRFSSDPPFSGMLDDILVADYALSKDQIVSLLTDSQPHRFVTAPLDIVRAIAGTEQESNPAVNSYDRNPDTYWTNDGTILNAWITYDLGAVSKINRVKLMLDNGGSLTYPLAIMVDKTKVFSGPTNTSSNYWETSFTPVSGRYVTVRMTGSNSSATSRLSIRQVQIWEPRE